MWKMKKSVKIIAITGTLLTGNMISFSGETLLNNPSNGAEKNSNAILPDGVRIEWDLSKAFKETTQSREKICINGLWRWQPVTEKPSGIPHDKWGYFKVPAPWPNLTYWMSRNSNTVYKAASWASKKLDNLSSAWYQREIEIPQNWAGRRIVLNIGLLNSYCEVYIGDNKAGCIRFPGGELDITSFCTAGDKKNLSLFVAALPICEEIVDFGATYTGIKSKGNVNFKGLCGDVWLASMPKLERIDEIKTICSYRNKSLLIDGEISLPEDTKAIISGRILGPEGKEALLVPPTSVVNGKFSINIPWGNAPLWETDSPGICTLELMLKDNTGRVLDQAHLESFGFREFWIEGRDLILNGSPVHLVMNPIDSPLISAAHSTYENAKISMTRMKQSGINMVYSHNYSCMPGAHLDYEAILKAADETGMLFAFALPHIKEYDWNLSPEANGYKNHLEAYVKMAVKHPSVVMYAMNHNSLGYTDDQNPQKIDGLDNPDESLPAPKVKWRALGLKSEKLVYEIDPSRPIYHHESGNFSQMFTLNNYLDFVPAQEKSEWYRHWSEKGIKPLLLVEYGNPFYANWQIYRGGGFFNRLMEHQYFYPQNSAPYLGDAAYDLSLLEKARLRFEAKMWKAGKKWSPTQYPGHREMVYIPNVNSVQAWYMDNVIPQIRTSGVTGFCVWEIEQVWMPTGGIKTSTVSVPTDYSLLQCPGYSPDFIPYRNIFFYDCANKDSAWTPSPCVNSYMRWIKPVIVYIAGKESRFTSKDQNYLPGEFVEKQLIAVNDSRHGIDFKYSWKCDGIVSGSGEGHAAPGGQFRAPIKFEIPASSCAAKMKLEVFVELPGGEIRKDSFSLNVLPKVANPVIAGKIALFDPAGESIDFLKDLGLKFEKVDADSSLAGYDMLVIGRNAITADGKLPDVSGVRDGLKVVVMEQTADALETRLGFRVQEYGLRKLFKRTPSHPILSGISEDWLENWRGEASLLPSYVKNDNLMSFPTTVRAGFLSPQAWRCGCYGNLVSVLIEKPAIGNFLPILDGGFDLQYSPLLEFRDGKGMLLFCQLDFSKRTENDPAGKILAANIFKYAANFKAQPYSPGVYVGDDAGFKHLQNAGFKISRIGNEPLPERGILVLGPGGAAVLNSRAAQLGTWIKNGGRVVTVGLKAEEIKSLPCFNDLSFRKTEYISSVFKAFPAALFQGVGCADVNIRDPREIDLLAEGGGVQPFGDGAIACDGDSVAFIQLAPWQFDDVNFYNLKPTFKRLSCLLTRTLCNVGINSSSPIIERLNTPMSNVASCDFKELSSHLRIFGGGKVFPLPFSWKGLPLADSEVLPSDWLENRCNESGWRVLKLPGIWGEQYKEFIGLKGTFLVRLVFDVPAELAEKDAMLILGRISDEDCTYLNGKQIGAVTKKLGFQEPWNTDRYYKIPAGLLKKKGNILAIKLVSFGGVGSECGVKGSALSKEELKTFLAGFPDSARVLTGIYMEFPEENDNPYRYFRW